jgi:hypothetical protein
MDLPPMDAACFLQCDSTSWACLNHGWNCYGVLHWQAGTRILRQPGQGVCREGHSDGFLKPLLSSAPLRKWWKRLLTDFLAPFIHANLSMARLISVVAGTHPYTLYTLSFIFAWPRYDFSISLFSASVFSQIALEAAKKHPMAPPIFCLEISCT